ncbi:phosphotransferases/inositol or phosphatidylinositol kinase [Actinidia rufa]|uniref:Phosphotransferases/inositol or phosphatidylinositol kinase n=1 Tax=Actinidia rufa TaxID=165716 RepID=A0A7J0D9M1_9ERIC|nr:phosphotransferases/inositol or phosphatidylinositol kinase [Actinidia rufa]
MLSSNIGVSSINSKSRNSACPDLKELDLLIFLDALVNVLADENRLHANAALSVLNVFAETLLFLARSKHPDMLMSRRGHGTPMIVSSPSMSHVYSSPPSIRLLVFEFTLSFALLLWKYLASTNWRGYGTRGFGWKGHCRNFMPVSSRDCQGAVYVLKRLPIYASKEREEPSQVLTQCAHLAASSMCRAESTDTYVPCTFLDIERRFKYKVLDTRQSLCFLLNMIFIASPLEATTTPRCEDIVSKEVQKNFIDPFNLVRVPSTSGMRYGSDHWFLCQTGEAKNIVGKGVDLALEQWWQLPAMSVHSKIPLLQQFQQLIEVQESARIIVDIANGNKLSGSSVGVYGGLYADLKDILETWRLQTQNVWAFNHGRSDIEAFVKIREQAEFYLEMKGELTSGLNLINNTNLEYFPAKHKAEIFPLKAYKETHEEIWLEYTVSCFFQGIKFGIPNSRSHLARVLYLLSFDTPNEPVGRAFDKYLDQLPHLVWLSWIPQLLLSLQRIEAPYCKLVLLTVAIVYPLVQKSERSTAGDGNVHAGSDQPLQQSSSAINDGQNALRHNGALDLVASAASAFDVAKDIMEALRSKHTNLASEVEILLTEIGSRFITLPEEGLLEVANVLLHRCYKYPTATTAKVSESPNKEVSGVCRACFSADAVNKHADFVREYKQDFEHDLDPESTTTFPCIRKHLYDVSSS